MAKNKSDTSNRSDVSQSKPKQSLWGRVLHTIGGLGASWYLAAVNKAQDKGYLTVAGLAMARGTKLVLEGAQKAVDMPQGFMPSMNDTINAMASAFDMHYAMKHPDRIVSFSPQEETFPTEAIDDPHKLVIDNPVQGELPDHIVVDQDGEIIYVVDDPQQGADATPTEADDIMAANGETSSIESEAKNRGLVNGEDESANEQFFSEIDNKSEAPKITADESFFDKYAAESSANKAAGSEALGERDRIRTVKGSISDDRPREKTQAVESADSSDNEKSTERTTARPAEADPIESVKKNNGQKR